MASAALMAAGMAVSMIGGLAQAGSASQTADAQASAYKAQGSAALAQAQNKAAQERDKYRRLASQQRAAYGSSGVDVNSGSPLDVLAATDAEGEVSAMQLLYSGELENWSARQRAAAVKNQAQGSATGSILGGMGGALGMGIANAGVFKGLLGSGANTGLASAGKNLFNTSIAGALK